MEHLGHYRAVAVQVRCDAVNACRTRAESQATMDATLSRVLTYVRGAIAFYGADTRLFVLPEYFLTSFPMGDRAADWIERACIRIPGPEIERVAEFCATAGVWISGNSYEFDPEWPGRFFQASWLVGPPGLVLKYRRLNSLLATSPHDLWRQYRERYSMAEIFPVADTPLGRLAAIASEEILFPEVARCLMMHGAEVFLHSTSDVGGHARMPKEVAKLARAVENVACVVSANSGGVRGIAVPEDSTGGRSKIVDHRGLVLAEADQGESIVAAAEIDLDALRRDRRRPGMHNLVARQRFELYAPVYAAHSFCPPDQFPDPVEGRDALVAAHTRAIEALVTKGIIQ